MAEAASIPQRGRGLFRAAIVAAALLLGACQTIVPRGSQSVAPPPPRRQAPPPEVFNGIPTDTGRNRVALLVPLSGPNSGVGQSLANATQLALLDTHSEQLRITNYDTGAGAAQAARHAIADGAKLILGPLLADDVRAVAPIAHAAGVPVVSFSNDASVAGDGAYLMGSAPSQSIDRVVAYARSQGATTFAALVPNDLYGQRASTSLLRSVESAGGQVVSLQTYQRAAGSIAAAVTKMAKNSPYDAVLIADTGGTAAAAVTLFRKTGVGAGHVLGTDLWNSESSIAARPPLAGAWFASVSDRLYRQYAAKYRMRFNAAPYRLSSMGYDAVLLTARIARDWAPGAPFPEDRLRDRGGFSGIDGAFRFGRDGLAERSLEVQEIRGGAVVTVSPAPGGFGAN